MESNSWQIHSFQCTEPRDWNDFLNDLVLLQVKPILGDSPAETLDPSEGRCCLPLKEKSFVPIDVHMIRELMALVRARWETNDGTDNSQRRPRR